MQIEDLIKVPFLPARLQAHPLQHFSEVQGVYVVCLQEQVAQLELEELWQAEEAVPPTQHPPILLVLLPAHPKKKKKKRKFKMHMVPVYNQISLQTLIKSI